MSDVAHKLAFILERLPIAIALLDASGQVLGKSGRLSGIRGASIPSRDPETRERWSFKDRQGALIAPHDWPSARALRGEHVPAGFIGRYQNEGEHLIRVTSVCTPASYGDIAAVVFLHELDVRTRAAEGSHGDFEYRLVDALLRSVLEG